jgi:DNA-binding IclR family transcriptional regulator
MARVLAALGSLAPLPASAPQLALLTTLPVETTRVILGQLVEQGRVAVVAKQHYVLPTAPDGGGQPPQGRSAPQSPPCPHATAQRPCCAACATVQAAEAVLVAVQTALPAADARAFPRTAVEVRILALLEARYPEGVAPRDVAATLGLEPARVQLMLQALTTLGVIDGSYRHRPPPPGDPGASPLQPGDAPTEAVRAPVQTQRARNTQRVLDALRAQYPAVLSPKTLEEQLGIAQASEALLTLAARGQVQRVRHGAYRYRPKP